MVHNKKETARAYNVVAKIICTILPISCSQKESGLMDDKGKLKLKGVSPKMLKRMKQEFVKCPVMKEDIQFVQCFICPNFQSRVMGEVLCKGDPLK